MARQQRVLVISGSAIVCFTTTPTAHDPADNGWDRMVGYEGHSQPVTVALDFFIGVHRVTALDLIPQGGIVTVSVTPIKNGFLDTDSRLSFDLRVVQHEHRPGLHILTARKHNALARHSR
ncbi:MAG: hypothetical protein HND48_02170 [Chloroflexi bacterium]|nr:hypothetical protein [Chloroflexota bacterium]MBV6437366.1 hypothetical protein [Anaerolineae bacterium]OQY81307.1 MAG: hypothetical protein B6D42_11425 [Anaerolineae bacterium UTCFX5]NOG48370.1 hypothetical protein [Chloroflexota bacterium]RIK22110.1 MAG: hypothetical protein DCC53_04405 [Chloroflexota bacterium]